MGRQPFLIPRDRQSIKETLRASNRVVLSKKSKSGGEDEDQERSHPPVGGGDTFASRIELMLRRLFVGREREIARFRAALDDVSEIGILLVTGETGIGKSALLNQFVSVAADAGSTCLRVDGRGGDVRPLLERAASVLRAAADAESRRPLLVVDHLDAFGEEERWFVEAFLPALPTWVLVVVADRRASLRADTFVPPFCERLSLRPLTDDESTEYLSRRNIADDVRARVLRISHGLPLLLVGAVSVAAFGGSLEQMESSALATVRHELAELSSSAERRAALATLALARTLAFEVLASVLDPTVNVEAVYKWLASRSFVEQTSLGLRPHMAARAAAMGWFREDHPRLFWSMLERLRTFYDWQLRQPVGPQARWVADRLFLQRHHPSFQHGIRVDHDAFEVVRARREDRDAIVALTSRQDGAAAAEWVARWLDAGIGTCEILRGRDGGLGGYVLSMAVGETWPAEVADDPALGVVRAFLDAQGWSSSSEVTAFVVRASLVEATEDGAISTLLLMHLSERLRAMPHLRFHFGVTRTPEVVLDLAGALDFEHSVVGSFHDGTFEHTVIAFDWRSAPRRVASTDSRFLARLEELANVPYASSVPPAERHSGAPPAESYEFGALLRAQLAQLATAAGLTSREKEVLDLLVLGRNSAEIGKVLGISARTAKFHQARLLSKLGADSRIDLLRLLL